MKISYKLERVLQLQLVHVSLNYFEKKYLCTASDSSHQNETHCQTHKLPEIQLFIFDIFTIEKKISLSIKKAENI
ncbi:hypothetical protein BpHYR1_008424 [Brachionus plicatilis]|uniref:Uncharacterized protein n=1 Tax=Brachionus plicatilis TaxID=10195 RepID=A0A3M7SB92_BRAPC|nr:hypothetical protein BpHYR1_008424 [Brachionus plicatilis]